MATKKVFIIDNDDVIYDCSPMREMAKKNLNMLIEKRGRNPDENFWNNLIEKYGTGFHPYLYSKEFSIPFSEIISDLIGWVKDIPIKSFVTETELRLLGGPCILFTENSLLYAKWILKQMELSNSFDYLLGFESFRFLTKTKSYQLVDEFVRSIYGDVQIVFIDDSVKNLQMVPPDLGWANVLFLKSNYALSKVKDEDRLKFKVVGSLAEVKKFLEIACEQYSNFFNCPYSFCVCNHGGI
jgi:FMN phosphatase YigB (HAD superfamily)